jgi:hypothetical protein
MQRKKEASKKRKKEKRRIKKISASSRAEGRLGDSQRGMEVAGG